MTAERYDLFRRTVAHRTHHLTVLAENMYHSQNAAALIRHCEAFGLQRMHTVEALCPFEPNAAIARGTEQWVDLVRHGSTPEAIRTLKAAGYRIVATHLIAKTRRPRHSMSPAGRSRWFSGRNTPEFRTRRSPKPMNFCVSRCAEWSKA